MVNVLYFVKTSGRIYDSSNPSEMNPFRFPFCEIHDVWHLRSKVILSSDGYRFGICIANSFLCNSRGVQCPIFLKKKRKRRGRIYNSSNASEMNPFRSLFLKISLFLNSSSYIGVFLTSAFVK